MRPQRKQLKTLKQCNDSVIVDIKNCLQQNEKPERNKKILSEEKGLKAYIKHFKLLLSEDQNDLLCINEYNPDYTHSPKISLSISLVLNCFELADKHPLSCHHVMQNLWKQTKDISVDLDSTNG